MSKWRNIKQIDTLVIHSAATRNGRFYFVDDIDEWHARRGFRRSNRFRSRQNPSLTAIGYHFVIYTNGAVATGRHLEEMGAHVKGHNLTSIGICLIGTDKFSTAQWQSLRANVQGLQQSFPATRAHTIGHRDLSPDLNGDGVIQSREWTKICPGFDVQAWLDNDMRPLKDHLLEEDHNDPD